MTNCWWWHCVCMQHLTCSASLLKSELRWVKQSLWDVTAADAPFCVCGWLSLLWGSFCCDSGTEICVSAQQNDNKVLKARWHFDCNNNPIKPEHQMMLASDKTSFLPSRDIINLSDTQGPSEQRPTVSTTWDEMKHDWHQSSIPAALQSGNILAHEGSRNGQILGCFFFAVSLIICKHITLKRTFGRSYHTWAGKSTTTYSRVIMIIFLVFAWITHEKEEQRSIVVVTE